MTPGLSRQCLPRPGLVPILVPAQAYRHVRARSEELGKVSYLGYPRLHFIGSFRADPPTVNNDPSHYDNDRFVTRFQRRQSGMEMNGWWNPDGPGAWELRGCQVGTVLASTDSATQGLDDVLG